MSMALQLPASVAGVKWWCSQHWRHGDVSLGNEKADAAAAKRAVKGGGVETTHSSVKQEVPLQALTGT